MKEGDENLKWKGNSLVFKGYATGDMKKPSMKVKDKDLLDWEQVKNCKSFGAILNKDFVDISFDSDELSEKFWNMAEQNNWNCLILENPENGHIHSYWKDTQKRISKGGKDKKLAVGLIADIHSGSTYIPLKVDGVERFPPSFEPADIDEVPEELLPVNTSQLVLDTEPIRRILNNINHFIFQDALSEDEMETITRDEAFAKPIFYKGKTFQHHVFGNYIKSQFHVKRINGQLHVYEKGVYMTGYRKIESKMIEIVPEMKATQRNETLKYLEVTTPTNEPMSDSKFIAFRNGVLNIHTMELLPHDPKFVITNMIPWDYNPEAYSELADNFLNNISCNRPSIRALLEECIGYCMFRSNIYQKAFILTGKQNNGKSTFLSTVEWVLGKDNCVSLDLAELAEKFSTSSIFGKLANIGDDISDEFLQGRQISLFKKVVSGNDIKAENKGQDVFFFKPTVKLLFSANEIPRVRNKGFDAIVKRLVIIPFDAKFSPDDPDFNPDIEWDLQTQEVAEYLIQLGVKGLQRVRFNHRFTKSIEVDEQIDSFKRDNNPMMLFLDEVEEYEIINQETKEVFARYDTFCHENGFTKVAMQTFSKEITALLDCKIVDKKINGRKCRVFVK